MIKKVYTKEQRYRQSKLDQGYKLLNRWIHKDNFNEVVQFIELLERDRLLAIQLQQNKLPES